jgi:hypothetical protein
VDMFDTPFDDYLLFSERENPEKLRNAVLAYLKGGGAIDVCIEWC